MPGYWNLRARANESDTLPTREQDYFFLVFFFFFLLVICIHV